MEDLKAKSSLSQKKTNRSMKKQGGEHGEDSEESLERMFGREYKVTCGDLTLLSAFCEI